MENPCPNHVTYVTNVFPGYVLFSGPVQAILFFYSVMKMSWFSKNCWERSALQQNRWTNEEDDEEKQDKEEEN